MRRPDDQQRRELHGFPASPGVGVGKVIHHVPAARLEGVVVAAEVAPADVVSLDPTAVTALATAAGAPLSHAAILARSLGIPAVTGLGDAVLAIAPRTVVLVDGDAGTVRIDPTGAEVDAARRRQLAARARSEEGRLVANQPAVTRDGRTVSVVVNVGSADDARQAVAEGADGVGMLRTEFAFLGRRHPPTEEEQYAAYRAIAELLGTRPLVVRTLDLGADIPAWNAAPEPNPALGERGIRFTLAHGDVFDTQLRAIARLARHRALGVMFPMVTTVQEARDATGRLRAVTDEPVDIGITVEVPAAAVTADAFAPMIDFFAIGTNDLTQYTLAADRSNAAVAGIADGLHPAVLRLIRTVTAAAERHGRSVCVVGELACDPLAVPVLVGLGVTALSVRPNAVADVKQLVRRVDLGAARILAEAALAADSAVAVRTLASEAWAASADVERR